MFKILRHQEHQVLANSEEARLSVQVSNIRETLLPLLSSTPRSLSLSVSVVIQLPDCQTIPVHFQSLHRDFPLLALRSRNVVWNSHNDTLWRSGTF